MKKILSGIILVIMLISIMGCGTESQPKHMISYVDGKVMELPFNDETLDCVCVFTEYTNNSGDTVIPADEISVKAYQNGTELSPWVFTGEKTDGYIQCDASVQTGTTAKVIWIFEREDASVVSVEFSDGQKFTVEE